MSEQEVVPKAPHAECWRCPLYESGTFVAASVPEGGAEVAFVGEAPGKQERMRGKVFVGPSGKLVTRILRYFGVKRSEVLLSNAMRCSYPEGENPPDEAIEACRPQLEADLKGAGVSSAVAMGNSAARSLTGSKEGITKQRVGPTRESLVKGVSVAPTFHPAACLRSAEYYPSVLTDVSKAVVGTASGWEEPIVHKCANRAEVIQECDSIRLFDGPVVVDIETGSDKDDTLARGHTIISLAMAPAEARDPDVVFIGKHVLEQEYSKQDLIKLFREKGVVCQNGKFDTGQMEWLWENNIPLAGDTMLASYALDERRGIHGLKYMAREFLGAPEYEAEIDQYTSKPKHSESERRKARRELERLSWEGKPRVEILRESSVEGGVVRRQAVEIGLIEEKHGRKIWWRPDPMRDHSFDIPVDADGTYASIPEPLLAYYNSCDVQATKLLLRYLEGKVQAGGLWDFYRWLISISEFLTDVELRALGVDFERNRELGDYCAEGIAKVESRLGELNPRSPKQVLEFLHSHGVPGAEGTAREVLEDLEQQSWVPEGTREVITDLLEYRKWHKLKSTYVDNVAAHTFDGKLHPTFKIHGATTGRLSSTPNVQNQPRGFGIKNQYVPPGGSEFTWVAADYGQAELRVLCWLAEDESIRELFNDPDRDVFTELSREMIGEEKFAGMDKYEQKEFRVQVKSFAYGLSYGREAESIAGDFDISQSAARKRMSSFRALIPDIMAYQKWIIKQVHQGHDLVNPFGRHRRFPLVTEDNARAIEREAMAYMPQSTASDITLESGRRANAEGIEVCNLIHDQILAQAPHSEAEDVGRRLEEIMVSTAQEKVGGYVAFEAEHAIGREWEKL